MKTLKITAKFNTLSEAVGSSKIDLSYNKPLALANIAATDRNVEQAFITEDGSVWYIFKCDIRVLNKFEPFHSCLDNSPFRVAFIVGSTLSIFDTLVPKTPAGRAWFKNDKFGALAA